MRIDPNKIDLLKKPFGNIIKDSDIDKSVIDRCLENTQKVITVGDTTTEKFINLGIIPDLSIIDGKEKRVEKNEIIDYPLDEKLYFENNPGEINEQILLLIKNLSLNGFEKKLQFIIEGEEDLLALPLFMYSPDGWTIFYGQPNEGLVVVEMNKDLRARAKLIFNRVFNIS